MKDIYERAQSTLIWLGEAVENTNAAFDLIDDFLATNREPLHRIIRKFDPCNNQHLQSERKRLKLFPDDLADFLESERLWRKTISQQTAETARNIRADDSLMEVCNWVRNSENDQSKRDAWNGIADLLERPWWTRAWTFQEAVVSSLLEVHCGSRQILFDDFVMLSHAYWGAMVQLHWGPVRPKFIDFDLTAMMRRESKPRELIQCLSMARRRRASDPRDKIYSILGLLSREARAKYNITPNYAKSSTKQEVYIMASMMGIIVERSWPTFIEISGHELEERLPSWAPDWSRNEEGSLSQEVAFRAGGNKLAPPEFLESNRVMKVWGFFVDDVDDVGDLDDGLTNSDPCNTFQSWAEIMKKSLQKNGTGPKRKHLEQFVRTIHLDQWENKERFPDVNGDKKEFHDFWIRKIGGIADPTVRRRSIFKRFFMLRNGYMGLAPARSQTGDTVYIVGGSNTPLVIRRRGEGNRRYMIVGECFVFGLMHGEILEMAARKECFWSTIFLV
ncbi:hypothetical protein PV11_03015 [Exophiala sideris]|uniref:Heterokaryon incompatibility domain-containing protein n=1 Tax=Exophiala sideris TaxID=1016849 RepID=A0A0D1YY26_9EURO|nr:hypothetical protein PV11_03015 [Exophiala sideris]